MKFMKIRNLYLLSTTFICSLAGATTNRVLTCTFTKNRFNAEPEILGAFNVVEWPGLLPSAQGSFRASSRNLKIDVNSLIIKDPDTQEEYVQTSMSLKVGETILKTSFSSKSDDQRAWVEINDEGFVLCTMD
ncbi:MAG: hypothetical protein ABIR96_09970 [Bdellovibrionota bacterium]